MPYISVLPFIDFLRKTGIEISIEESVQAQNVIDYGFFNITISKLRQSLKSILVRRRNDFEMFDSCFDIFFLKYSSLESLNIKTSSINENDVDNIATNNNSNVIHNQDNADFFQTGNGLPGSMVDSSGTGQGMRQPDEFANDNLLEGVLSFYLRWVPDNLQGFAKDFLIKQEYEWAGIIKDFVEFIYGHGQYKHSQTIAERYNRYSSHFTRAFEQLLNELKQREDIDFQINYLKQLELLKDKIQNFLRNIRIYILQQDDVDSSELLRYLYSGNYLPNIKEVLNDDFNRIEGDIGKVREYLLYLGKKIAIQERKKRIKSKRGQINIRKTIRKNISTGGAFLNISFHKKKKKDPKLILLADVSGSTEWISEFFFVLTYAAQSTFKKLALFEFDSTTVEITKGLNSPTLSQALLKRIKAWENPPRSRVGHSNYQTSFEDFIIIGEKYFGPNCNILILGDCRDWLGSYKQDPNNGEYVPESKLLLGKIVKRVKKVVILNPEQKSRWNTGDSVVSHYEDVGAKIVYVENIITMIEFIFKSNWYS